MPDGAANPYLLFAAIAACGLDGIDKQMDPGEPNTDNLYTPLPDEIAARSIETLPPTLLHTADNLAANDVLQGPGNDPGRSPQRVLRGC